MRQRKTGREVRIPVGALFGGKAVPLIGVNAPPNARCNVILKQTVRRGLVSFVECHLFQFTDTLEHFTRARQVWRHVHKLEVSASLERVSSHAFHASKWSEINLHDGGVRLESSPHGIIPAIRLRDKILMLDLNR